MRFDKLIILQVGALVVFLAGLLVSVAVFRQNAELNAKIRGKQETLASLAAIRQTRARHQAALSAFNALSNTVPADLPALCRAAITNTTPEIRARDTRKLADGWTLQQVEVVFSEIELGRVPVFLEMAERGRPPWRLVECVLTSSRQSDGFGRALLVLEALEKTSKKADNGE